MRAHVFCLGRRRPADFHPGKQNPTDLGRTFPVLFLAVGLFWGAVGAVAEEPSPPPLPKPAPFRTVPTDYTSTDSSQPRAESACQCNRGQTRQADLPTNPLPATPTGPVQVRLRSGRQVIGHLDYRTTGQELWLRTGSEILNIIRPIAWEEVSEIRLDGKPIPVGFLREFLDLLLAEADSEGDSGAERSGSPMRPLSAVQWQLLPPSLKQFVLEVHRLGKPARQPIGRIILEGKEDQPSDASDESNAQKTSPIHLDRLPSGADANAAAAPAPSRVAFLAVDAWLGQWDADVAADGLVLEITPFDAAGRPVPVHGMLEVILLIPPRGFTGALDQKSHRQRWVQQVRPENFSPATGSAQYRLPFGSLQNDPEWNPELAGHGAVSAQLSVPGQGTFSATAGYVRVRTFSPVRDRLQQSTGRRFFPWEQVQQ